MTQIAVLYPGAVGRALAEAFAPLDHRLLSYVADRSARSRENARSAGIHVAASFAELVDTADVVVSLVPPVAALDVARRYAAALSASRGRGRPNRQPLYIDANSIAPGTVATIAGAVRAAGATVVDGVFIGPAAPINPRTLLMLSGAEAHAAAELFAPAMAVKVVGGEIGQASAVKMAMALMTKALVALFVELSCAAGKAGGLEATLEVMRRLYPGTLEFLERTLPTYPVHLARRIGEMREAESWLATLGQAGAMTRAASEILERIKAVLPSQSEPFAPLLERIVALDPLGRADGAAKNLKLLPATKRFAARRPSRRARRRLV